MVRCTFAMRGCRNLPVRGFHNSPHISGYLDRYNNIGP
ncbi:hypothetical protein SMG44B_40500 [Stenotrophomonas maltophilia]